jgi:hypothetical protein
MAAAAAEAPGGGEYPNDERRRENGGREVWRVEASVVRQAWIFGLRQV